MKKLGNICVILSAEKLKFSKFMNPGFDVYKNWYSLSHPAAQGLLHHFSLSVQGGQTHIRVEFHSWNDA